MEKNAYVFAEKRQYYVELSIRRASEECAEELCAFLVVELGINFTKFGPLLGCYITDMRIRSKVGKTLDHEIELGSVGHGYFASQVGESGIWGGGIGTLLIDGTGWGNFWSHVFREMFNLMFFNPFVPRRSSVSRIDKPETTDPIFVTSILPPCWHAMSLDVGLIGA